MFVANEKNISSSVYWTRAYLKDYIASGKEHASRRERLRCLRRVIE